MLVTVAVAVVVGDGGCYVVRVVKCLEDALGLSMNLSKSRIFGVGLDIKEVESVSTSLICVHDSIPFVYLGLLVGKRMHFYDGLENFGISFPLGNPSPSPSGRLTLIIFVLGSMPIYFVSLFKDPQKTIGLLEYIRA
ncbi:hypothetical protein Tco_0526983 [Tanacetum coccineum]